MSKESFKLFIRKNPNLAKMVMNGDVTYQKLYETYDIYGEDSEVFTNLLNKNEVRNNSFSFNEVTNMIKNIDLESIQKGVEGLEKAINLVQEIVPKNQEKIGPYQERPINKYYED